MVAAFIPWLAIRLVVEFVFRPHFLAPLTMTARNCHAPRGCGYGLGSVPQITGRVGDLVLTAQRGVITYQPATGSGLSSSSRQASSWPLPTAALGATIWLLHRRAA